MFDPCHINGMSTVVPCTTPGRNAGPRSEKKFLVRGVAKSCTNAMHRVGQSFKSSFSGSGSWASKKRRIMNTIGKEPSQLNAFGNNSRELTFPYLRMLTRPSWLTPRERPNRERLRWISGRSQKFCKQLGNAECQKAVLDDVFTI